MIVNSVLSRVISIRGWIRSHTTSLWSAIGVIVGVGFSTVGNSHAAVAVASSPGLTDLGLVQAIVINHTGDWLFHNHPVGITFLMIMIWGTVGFGVGFKR